MKFPKRLRHRGKGKVLATIYKTPAGYRLYWRQRVDGKRKSQMKLFGNYASAKREGDKVVTDLANGTASALSPGQAADAQNAIEELQRFYQTTGKRISIRFAVGSFCEASRKLDGRALAEAVDGFLSNVATVKRVDLAEAVKQFVEGRKLRTVAKDGKRPQLSPGWHYIVAMWLREFAKSFPGHAVCDLSREHLTAYCQRARRCLAPHAERQAQRGEDVPEMGCRARLLGRESPLACRRRDDEGGRRFRRR